jgi:hypothetical protein
MFGQHGSASAPVQNRGAIRRTARTARRAGKIPRCFLPRCGRGFSICAKETRISTGLQRFAPLQDLLAAPAANRSKQIAVMFWHDPDVRCEQPVRCSGVSEDPGRSHVTCVAMLAACWCDARAGKDLSSPLLSPAADAGAGSRWRCRRATRRRNRRSREAAISNDHHGGVSRPEPALSNGHGRRPQSRSDTLAN